MYLGSERRCIRGVKDGVLGSESELGMGKIVNMGEVKLSKYCEVKESDLGKWKNINWDVKESECGNESELGGERKWIEEWKKVNGGVDVE